MFRQLKIIACVILGIASVAAYAVDPVYPTVTLTYYPDEWKYVYRVDCPENMSYPFGYFQVDTYVPCEGIYCLPDDELWGLEGPSTSVSWANGINTFVYDSDGNALRDFAFWRSNRKQEVMPGNAWTGYFVMYVPNTAPKMGFVMTKDGVTDSTRIHEIPVPAPIPPNIPEPGGIVAFCTSLILSYGTFLRSKK